MTICGIKNADGVCVMGECPYFKKCCPVVWDKSKAPTTNEEYIKALDTEQLAEFIDGIARDGGDLIKRSNKSLIVYKHNFWEEWLKLPYKGGKIMKCPKCGGNAELSNWGSLFDPDYADFHVECERCGYHSMGSTDPQKAKEMFEKGMGMYYTNEQWFCLLSTEEKAKVFANATYSTAETPLTILWGGKEAEQKKWEMWLKQPHT